MTSYTKATHDVWLPYTQMLTAPAPYRVIKAKGTRLVLANGIELLDGIASWWTVAHGYCHPHIVEAICEQASVLPHVMLGGLAHDQVYRLASRLTALLPGDLDHVFFSESGSVSVEIAMKMAIQYWLSFDERRTRFLSFKGGYHGDTFAAMSVCDPDDGMHGMFRGAVSEQIFVDLPVDEASVAAFDLALATHGNEIAAILIEPLVQGAGGMRFHQSECLRFIREACDRHNILLIFDEIFVGFGRTGMGLFACQAAGVQPDILTLSKALTGGTLPLAATVASSRVYQAFLSEKPGRSLMHGPTYMGNALACAAANASLDLFEGEPRVAQSARIGGLLQAYLAEARNLRGVRDVRVLGAIGVVQLDQPVPTDLLTAQFVGEGVWLRPFGDIVYTTPPLTASDEEVEKISRVMVNVLQRTLRDIG